MVGPEEKVRTAENTSATIILPEESAYLYDYACNFFEHGHYVLSLVFGKCSLISSVCDDTVVEVSALLHPHSSLSSQIGNPTLVVVMHTPKISASWLEWEGR